jgi:glycosyltransferase involved in cell wall biosynthesis
MGHVPEYSIIIPAYNEEKRLPRLLSHLHDTDAEFIFVCDGTDRTAERIMDFSATHPELTVRCLTFHSRLGKGGGVYEGFRVATAPLVGFIDADNSTTYAEMVRLIHLIGANDGVIGSRHMPGSDVQIHQPFARRVQSRVFNLIIRILFGLQYYDTQCGAKVFRREALLGLIDSLHATGFEFDVEILWKMKRAGFTVIEVPVAWNNEGDSRLKSSDVLSMFVTLIRLRLFSND